MTGTQRKPATPPAEPNGHGIVELPVAKSAPAAPAPAWDEGLDYRRRYQGLIGIGSKIPIRDRAILSLVYTPGVAEACLAISEDPLASFDLTCRGNTVAILTDGSDIFGREGGPPEAAIPLEEAKSVIFKTFAGVDAFPLSLATSDPDQIVETGLALSSTFGAICLDDISAPRAFTIADNLENGADIPVFSNQHHGTAILVLGGLINALKVVGKRIEDVKVVISGAGVAGIGVARLLTRAGARDLVVCDRAGAVYKYRPQRMNWAKAYLAKETNLAGAAAVWPRCWTRRDVFVGLSTGGIVTEEMVRSMAPDPIVFALAVPEPEISPAAAREAGAKVVATGRSDFPNTMDVSLVFPGVFRGLLDSRARNIRLRTLLYAAAGAGRRHPAGRAARRLHRAAHLRLPRRAGRRGGRGRAALEAGEAGREISPELVSERTRRYVYEGRLLPPKPSARGEHKTFREEAIDLRLRHGGVLEIRSKIPIRDHHILNMLYVPPAALAPAHVIRDDPSMVDEITAKGNLVAIVTDGSAVLGLGDIGPQAALPVMEGKAVLLQTLAGVEAFPICLAARDVDEIVGIVQNIAPNFGGINLEDISAPRCFEIERKLRETLDMPVFHDDQHGTAIVVAAALINGCKIRGCRMDELRVTVNGAGAAGIAVSKLLLGLGVGDVVLCDRAGAIYKGRTEHMDFSKEEIARLTNKERPHRLARPTSSSAPTSSSDSPPAAC